jgi:hypothetical protein
MPLSNQQPAERPAHVHVKKAKGRSYLYYWTGQGHIRLPDMDDPAFSDALEEAQLVRWRASKLTLPPMPLLLEGPTGDDLHFIRAADAVKIGRTVDVWNRLKKMQVEFGTYEGGRAWAYVHTNADIIGETDDAPTEAVAICAAALRARAQEQHS